MSNVPRIAEVCPETLDGFPVELIDSALACGYLLLNEDRIAESGLGEVTSERSAIAVEVAESISGQLLTSTSMGYQSTLNNLNEKRADIIKFPVLSDESLVSEFRGWFSPDIFKTAVTLKGANPGLEFTLIARPNLEINNVKFVRAVKAFGYEQNPPAESYIFEDFIHKLTANEISGSSRDRQDPVMFSLIPSATTSEMEGTLEELSAKIAQMQEEFPSIRVPNLLDALTYWQTLRSQEVALNGDEVFARTNIYHFDIPAKHDNGIPSIPMSCISGDGVPELYDTGPNLPRPARISIG